MARIIAVTGKSGSGKTYWARAFVEKSRKHSIVLDRVGRDGKSDYAHDQAFSSFLDFSGFMQYGKLPPGRVTVLQFDSERDWDFGLRLLAQAADYALIVDEASYYMSPHQINQYLENLIRLHRNRGLDIVLISHRPVDFNRLVITFADTVVAYKDEYEGNLERLSDITYIGKTAYDLLDLRDLGVDPRTGKAYTEHIVFGAPVPEVKI